jgi:hypothetical protein
MGSFFLHAFGLDHVYYSPQLKKILAPSLRTVMGGARSMPLYSMEYPTLLFWRLMCFRFVSCLLGFADIWTVAHLTYNNVLSINFRR